MESSTGASLGSSNALSSAVLAPEPEFDTIDVPQLTNKQFEEECQALLAKHAFSPESVKSIRPVEHICSFRPEIIEAVFGAPKEPSERGHFTYFGKRMKVNYYADDQGTIYAGVRFNANSEGAPGLVHGGALATVIDVALCLIYCHKEEQGCLTGNLGIVYENTTPVNKTYLVRAWISKQVGRKMYTECDLISLEGTLQCRGTAMLASFPKADPRPLTRDFVQERIIPIKRKIEEAEDATFSTLVRRTKLNFPDDPVIAEKFGSWYEISYKSEFPDVGLKHTHGFYAAHRGWHFETSDYGSTFLLRRFQSPERRFAGAAYFSENSQGPPTRVHGGCVATAFDCFLSDAVFFTHGWGYVTRSLHIKLLRATPIMSVAYFTPVEFLSESPRGYVVKTALTDASGKVYCIAIADFRRLAKTKTPSFEDLRNMFGRTSGLTPQGNRDVITNFMVGSGKL